MAFVSYLWLSAIKLFPIGRLKIDFQVKCGKITGRFGDNPKTGQVENLGLALSNLRYHLIPIGRQ